MAARKRGRPNCFAITERALREYKYMPQDIKNLQAELETLREALLPKTSTDIIKPGQGSTRTPFDTSQTERGGIRLAEHKQICILEKTIREKIMLYTTLTEARMQLAEHERQYLKLRYDLEKSHQEVQNELKITGFFISERNYYRFRQSVVNKIAQYIGVSGG